MQLLRLIETIRTPFLDTVMGLVTRLGEEALALAVLCLVFWCVNKRAAYVIGVAFFFSGLTVQCMKICFRTDRPWVTDPALRPVPSALVNSTGYSFPSGHTQSAAALFGSLGAQAKRKAIKALCFSAVAPVAFSRLYLGVHTLPDVAVSLLITFALVWITTKVFTAENIDATINKKREFIVSLIMTVFAATVTVIAAVLYFNKAIEKNYVSDCAKAAGAGVAFAAGMFIERVYIGFPVKAKSIFRQCVKFALGLAVTLAIKEGLKPLIGTGLIADMFRYFLMIAWVTVLFPMIIKRLARLKD